MQIFQSDLFKFQISTIFVYRWTIDEKNKLKTKNNNIHEPQEQDKFFTSYYNIKGTPLNFNVVIFSTIIYLFIFTFFIFVYYFLKYMALGHCDIMLIYLQYKSHSSSDLSDKMESL